MHTRKLTVLIALTMLAGMAQADTQAEIRDVVKANIAHTNKTMTQDPSRISKEGSKEFFSSVGSTFCFEILKLAIDYYIHEFLQLAFFISSKDWIP